MIVIPIAIPIPIAILLNKYVSIKPIIEKITVDKTINKAKLNKVDLSFKFCFFRTTKNKILVTKTKDFKSVLANRVKLSSKLLLSSFLLQLDIIILYIDIYKIAHLFFVSE